MTSRIHFALLLVEAADPAGSRVVLTMAAEYVMNLIDQQQRESLVFIITRSALELQEVAHGKGVGPQVATWDFPGR